MELTLDQLQSFKEITDYNEKLKWWNNLFLYDITPRNQDISIVPSSIEEAKSLIDWYEVYFTKTEAKSNYEFDSYNCRFSLGETLYRLSYEERKQYLLNRKTGAEVYFKQNSSLINIRIGIKYEEDPKIGLEQFFTSITKTANPCITIQSFFHGRHNKRMLDIISELLTDYIETQEVTDTPKMEKQAATKLKWQANKVVLYHLFAQLSHATDSKGKPVIGNTIETLAMFLSQNVEGFPSPETIEAELGRLRNEDSIPPKRYSISLEINKE